MVKEILINECNKLYLENLELYVKLAQIEDILKEKLKEKHTGDIIIDLKNAINLFNF